MLDPEGDTHLYLQISEILRSRIGQAAVGDQVPSEADLQHEFGVARTTARRAIRVLRDENLVHTVHGQGTFVGAGPDGPIRPRKTPMYRQIADELARQISAGTYRPRRPIPSETTLSQRYDVARETVRRAMATMRAEGWLYTVPQRGTYVAPEERWPTAPEDRQTPAERVRTPG